MSCIVLVAKTVGSPMLCMDHRNLDAVMKRDRWTFPLIDEIFDEVKGSIIFTA